MKTYLRKEARRHGSSLQITDAKLDKDIAAFADNISGKFSYVKSVNG